jgi:hypothetical protein
MVFMVVYVLSYFIVKGYVHNNAIIRRNVSSRYYPMSSMYIDVKTRTYRAPHIEEHYNQFKILANTKITIFMVFMVVYVLLILLTRVYIYIKGYVVHNNTIIKSKVYMRQQDMMVM